MKPRTYSPAALELMAAGIELRQIADALGVTKAAVSLWLRGARTPDPALHDTIALLTDAVTADRILQLITEEATP